VTITRAQQLRGCGLLLLLLGGTVIGGWLLKLVVLTRLVPHLRSMVLNTALSFALLGLALAALAAAASPLRDRGVRLAALLVALLAGANLLQWQLGLDLGIDLARFHAWADDGNPNPGRMSLPTTLGFLLASLSLALASRRAATGGKAESLGRLLAASVIAIGGISLLGYALGLEALFGTYPLAGMAIHTAAGMCLLGASLWLAWARVQPDSATPSSERLLLLVGWAPALVALSAGIAGIWSLKNRIESEQMQGLQATQTAHVEQIATILSLRGTRAALVASQVASQPPGRLEPFLAYGFSHLEISDLGGQLLSKAGAPAETRLELPLQLAGVAGGASLVWTGQDILLRLRSAMADGRTLLSEQPLPQLSLLLGPPGATALREGMQLCGVLATQIVCLPSAVDPRPQPQPIQPEQAAANTVQAAIRGGPGAGSFRDHEGRLYLAVYSPVADTGLVSAFQADSAELNADTRNALVWGGLLVLLLTAAGTTAVTRRVRLQAAELLRARRQYALVVNSLQEGLILQGADGRILTSNPAAERILGRGPAQLARRSSTDTDWQAIHQDGSPWPGEEHPAMRTLRSGQAESNQIMGLRRPDGRDVWLSVNSVSAGAGEGVVTSFTDITERRAAEQREHELQGRLRQLIESLRDYALCTLDPQGRINSWNSSAERLFGYREEEILGQPSSRFYPPEDAAAGKPERSLAVARDQGRSEEEGWRLRKDGSRYWANVILTPIHDDAGRLLGFAKIARDLSERLQADQALAEANHLREAILEAAPFSIIATDPDGTIRSINPAAERMLWYRREELVGQTTPALIHDPEEIRLRAQEMSAELGQHIEPGFEVFVHQSRRGIVEEREWTYVRKDGSRFPVNLAVAALHGADGEIQGFLGIAYDITERKRREEYTQHIAHHDYLTGLPNRTLLNDRLEVALRQSKRSGTAVAVLMLDLDHFKRVNDSLGHHIGDQLLVAVADRLRDSVRDADTVARMGGDEFVVVVPALAEPVTAEHIAQKILDSMTEKIVIGNHELHITPSIGISLYPRDGADAHVLLRDADTAMYRAKAAGRGTFRVFNLEMEQAANDKLSIENALHRALRNQEFVLHYQPQICLSSGAVVGMEALLRWADPQGVLRTAEHFIAVAEESGLILPLGSWVLRTACHQGRALQRQCGRELKVAINISPKQFRQPHFVEELQAALRESGLSPESLELEITESLLMAQTEESISRLQQIRALGVGVAIDDFGVGYSSLSYISRFPITTLKIDRSFINQVADNLANAAVTQTIIALASSLGIRVVAEGVETAAQLDFLRRHHCQDAQGNFLGVDLPPERFSVQGFHFSPGVAYEHFGATLDRLQPSPAESPQ
jgi:diguanylate cyclase (GGDEF)-like protein/PAS domain S-box-containing protein